METLTNKERIRIGQLLVHKKLISSTDLDEGLAVQNVTGKKLGEILVQRNLVPQPELERILQEQHWRNAGFWVID